jgi:Lar family restriction alleviation protein
MPLNRLRCPFCLHEESGVIDDDDRVENAYVVACVACGAQGPIGITPVSAIELWNARGKPRPTPDQQE